MNDRTPDDVAIDLAFRDTFERTRAGEAVLKNLVDAFVRRPPLDGSAQSMNRTVILAAQREVIDYIARRINRANGAPPEPEGEEL